MVDTLQKNKNQEKEKGALTEEDVCTVLQRYSAGTVLALLKEVAQFVDVKIDWRALVEKTETGIKNVREYQMLWRHLAYRQPLIDNIGPEDQPLDDDSDLEYEVEACPAVSTADALEVSNCVKVLTSGSANKSRMPSNSSFDVARISLENPQVLKQSEAAGTSGEGLGANRSTSNIRKKRKTRSEDEDIKLIATIKKGEVKGERNTTQRAQKANTSRKKQGSLNIGEANIACAQLSEVQLATRYAINMALKDNPASGSTCAGNGDGSNDAAKISSSKTNLPIIKVVTGVPSQPQSCVTASVKAVMGSSMKLCPQRKTPPQSSVVDSIQAVAVAAGARIASPADAASLFKAAQLKNAVHFRGGASLVKTSPTANSSPLPYVHRIYTGLAAKPASVLAETASFVAGGQQAKASTVVTTEQIITTQQLEFKTSTEANIQQLDTQSVSKEDGASQCLPKVPFDKCRATSPGAVGINKQTTAIGYSGSTMNMDVDKIGSRDKTCN